MKSLSTNSLQLDDNPSDFSDSEIALVSNIINTAKTAGVHADPITVINMYVSLKSKPLAILVGHKEKGKIILIRRLAKALMGQDPIRSQFMNGHAWWAERNSNVALFTQAQTHFNDEKISTLIENARRSENNNRAHIVCLTRISPAEVSEYFSVIGHHHRSSHEISSLNVNFSTSYSYPQNLFFIGTMDAHQFHWYSDELLSNTTIIHWPNAVNASDYHIRYAPIEISPNGEKTFLVSSIRTEQSAYSKLQPIFNDQPHAILPMLEVEKVMMTHGVEFSMRLVTNEVIVYLANAWTEGGLGLFASSPKENLRIALDLAISQIVFPRGYNVLSRSITLRETLRKTMNGQYVNSLNFLDRLEFVS